MVRPPVLAIALLGAAFAWTAAIGVGPALTSRAPVAAAAVYAMGSIVCHQHPARSFQLRGTRLPVCARCTALYSGAAVGMLAWLLWRGRGRAVQPTTALAWTVAAAAPTMLSVASAWVGVWDGSNAARAIVSVPLGLVLGGVAAAVAARDLR